MFFEAEISNGYIFCKLNDLGNGLLRPLGMISWYWNGKMNHSVKFISWEKVNTSAYVALTRSFVRYESSFRAGTVFEICEIHFIPSSDTWMGLREGVWEEVSVYLEAKNDIHPLFDPILYDDKMLVPYISYGSRTLISIDFSISHAAKYG